MIGSVLLRLCWVVRLVLAVPVDLEELAAGTPTATGSLSKRTLRRMLMYFSLWNNLTASLASLAAAYSGIALRFAGRWILLQLAVDDLASSAEEPLKVPCTCFVVDVADEDAANFSLDHTMTDVDMSSRG
jgi:hypothetical protein